MAAAAAVRPPIVLAPPNPPTTHGVKCIRLPAAPPTAIRNPWIPTRFSSHNLSTKHRFLSRCLPSEPPLTSATGNPSSPAPDSGHQAHNPPPVPAAPPPPGLVLDVGPAQSWDAHAVGSPVVKRYVGDDKDRWLMWYHGSSAAGAGDSVGLAISNNGVHWERAPGPVASRDGAGLVMGKSDDWWAFDTMSVRPAEILIMSSDKLISQNSVYWMYYTGFTSETVENAGNGPRFQSMPGLAISQDGRHWARIEGEHHSGALFDVGADGEWDEAFVAAPSVFYHGRGDLRMYYHSFDRTSGHYSVGIARSRDGIRWVKLGKVMGAGAAGSFDEGGVRNAHVVKDEGRYLMAYEGVSADGQTSIGLATSADGLKEWRRCGEAPTLEPCEDEDGWDSRGVGAPSLVQMVGGDEWRLYYSGLSSDGRVGIGLAVSHGSKLTSFERWKGFHVL